MIITKEGVFDDEEFELLYINKNLKKLQDEIK